MYITAHQVIAVSQTNKHTNTHFPSPPLPKARFMSSFVRSQHISPELGVPLAFRDYATDCALLQSPASALPPAHWWRWGGVPTPAWGVLRAALLDEFTLAHSLGWWAKALLLRDKGLLWAYSIGFELMERSFAVRACAPAAQRCVLWVRLCFRGGSMRGQGGGRCCSAERSTGIRRVSRGRS